MSSQPAAPPPPDYSDIAEAQSEAAMWAHELAMKQFKWAKKTYTENKEITDEVVEGFMKTQRRSDRNAFEDRERYEDIFQPLEDNLARDARRYSSHDRKEREMGRAVAGVGQQFQASRTAAQRDLEAYGINPGSTRFAALDIGARTMEAASKAAAASQASHMVDATGRALRSEAINIGRGYPGQIAGTYNTALQAGTGSVNSGLATTASGANTMGTAPQYAGIQGNALAGWGSTLNMGHQNAMAAWNANQQASSGWGSALGLIGGIGMKAMTGGMFNDGGVVPDQVSPTRGKAIDDIPAQVTAGEFIMPKDAVEWHGQKAMYALIEKADKDREEMKQRTGAIPTFAPGPSQQPSPDARAQALRVN